MHFLKPLLPLSCLLLLSACSHYYYAPNVLHQPVLHDRHDASVRAGLGLGSGYLNTDIQAAYSPVKHAALMYNYFYIGGSTNTPSGSREIKGWLHEGGIGGYYDLGDMAQLSLYGGLGQGKVFNSYEEEGVTSEVELQRWFVQPGIVVYDQKLRFNLGLRFSHVSYGDAYFDTRLEGQNRADFLFLAQESPFLLIETGLGIGLNVRPFVFSLNFVNSQARQQEFAYKRGNSNLTVALDIHQLWRKRGKGER